MCHSMDDVRALAAEYLETEPLAVVEQEHVETFPATVRGGEFGRRDVEWVVQWYYRRHLGGYSNRERRAAEGAFRENDFEDVLDTLADVVEQDALGEKLDRLSALHGVDVGVASAFLFFTDPERFVPIGEREWRGLRELGAVDGPMPDIDAGTYVDWHETCSEVRDAIDVDAWTLYRALWLLGTPE